MLSLTDVNKLIPDSHEQPIHVSVVTTVYKTQSYLVEFYNRVLQLFAESKTTFEIIFVNDGSPDDSELILTELAENDERVKVVNFSRNFGHHKAMMTGLRLSQGQYVFLIDSDLEEAPELFHQFYKEIQADTSCDAIYGVQQTRSGSFFERVSGYCFYTLFNALSELKIPRNFMTVRLMTRRYVDGLVQYLEKELNFSTLTVCVGFKTKPIAIEKKKRQGTSYSLLKKLSIFTNAITSSSTKPLWFIFYLGLSITLVAVFLIVNLLIQYVFNLSGISGWRSLIISIWFLGGISISMLGVVAIYISKIFLEIKARPYVVIKEKHNL